MPCMVCKRRKKRCGDDCIFKSSIGFRSSEDLDSVIEIFGFARVAKILKQANTEDRGKALESLVWEKDANGPLGHFNRLMEEIESLKNNQVLQQNFPGFSVPNFSFQQVNGFGVQGEEERIDFLNELNPLQEEDWRLFNGSRMSITQTTDGRILNEVRDLDEFGLEFDDLGAEIQQQQNHQSDQLEGSGQNFNEFGLLENQQFSN